MAIATGQPVSPFVNQQQQQTTGNTGNGKQKKEAMGYLNLKVKTASGDFITIPCYIPLEEDKPVHVGIMNKIKDDPEFVFEVQATVGVKSNIVPEF